MAHCTFTCISLRLETLRTLPMRTMKEDLLSIEVGVSLFFCLRNKNNCSVQAGYELLIAIYFFC